MKELKDKDLREALRRRETRRTKPEVPADFMDNVMQEIAPKPVQRARYTYIAALTAAACIVLAVLMVWPKVDEQKSVGSRLIVRNERTNSQKPSDLHSDSEKHVASTKETTEIATPHSVPSENATPHSALSEHVDTKRRVQPAKTVSDSLDYYISKIEHELAQMDDSLYIERIHRVMHADERLQRIVNNYILNELRKDVQPHQASNINNVKTDENEE